MKRGIDVSTITHADFKPPLSTMDRTTRQKISKGMEELNNTANQKEFNWNLWNTLSTNSILFQYQHKPLCLR